MRPSWPAIRLALAAAITLSGCGGESRHDATQPAAGGSPEASVTARRPIYPLTASANHRYLVDSEGAPVLLVGDGAAQTLVQRIPDVVTTYLDDRAAHGFNALWMHVIVNDQDGGNVDGQTDDGIKPFVTTLRSESCSKGPCYDLSAPNPAYFARVDQILKIAAANGMVVFLDTLENNSYLQLFQLNGRARVARWAQYLVERYKSFPNIVWMTGNDFQTWSSNSTTQATDGSSATDNQLAQTIMATIAATDSTHLQTTELNYNMSGSLDDQLLVPFTSLAAAYSYYPVYHQALRGYDSTARTAPVYLIESYYEHYWYGNLDPHSADDRMLRKIPYWTVLAGGLGGYFYGSIWYVFPNYWRNRIDTRAVTQLGYWKELFTSLPWYDLVPDQNHLIVTAGYGTPSGDGRGNIQTDAYVTAGGTPDHRLAIAYLPAGGTITVDMTRLSGTVVGQWFDPTTGTYAPVANSPFPNTGLRSFAAPGHNGAGDADWVLILRVQ
ncbi:MAG TPA: DUF4038 domain-containing protein [Steroidobacteraceae bacterium]|jgi:hypothetical protein